MDILKRVGIVSFVLLITIMSFASITVSAEQQEHSGQYDFDVVFVADGSGSMLTADPDRLVAQAISEFFDVMDDSCRVGYVIYAHKLVSKHDLVSIGNSEEMDKIQKQLNGIQYDPANDTDISLGLTEAKKILDKAGSSAGRKQMIVLLSDGNTDLPKGPRTVEESEKELTSTLKTLKDKNVRVYTIGLNYDGSLDTSAMNNIASTTNAKSFEAKKSSELQRIVINIFADYEGIDPETIKSEFVEKKDGKGDYIATIPIKNSSVYLANIVVNSTSGISNPKLTNPNGFDVSLDNNSQVKIKKGRNYIVVKIFSPEVGDWKLTVEGMKEDDVNFNLLESYTFYVDQQIKVKTVTADSDVTITASLYSKDGIVKDSDLISTIESICTVNTGSGDPHTINLKHTGEGVFTGTYHVDKEGSYSFQTTIRAKNGSFEKVSKSQSVSAEDIWNAIVVEQAVSEDSLQAGEHLSIESRLVNGDKVITDPIMLSNYTTKVIITDESNNTVSEETLMLGEDGIFSTDYVFSREGLYKVATAVENNVTGDVKKSDLDSIHVARATIKQLSSDKDSTRVDLVTAPRRKDDKVILSEFFFWSKDDNLKIEQDPSSSKYYKVSVDDEGDEVFINFEGLKSGKENVAFLITDGSGNTAKLNVEVYVENGWKPFIIGAIIILVVVLLVLLVFLLLRSKLRGKGITVSVIVPSALKVSTPAKQDLQLPNKHSTNMLAVLQFPQNSFERESLRDAVNAMSLSGTLRSIKLISTGKHSIDVEITGTEEDPYIVNNTQVTDKQVFTLEDGSSQKFDLQCYGNGHLIIKYTE